MEPTTQQPTQQSSDMPIQSTSVPVQPPVPAPIQVENPGPSKLPLIIITLLFIGALASAVYFYYKTLQYEAALSQQKAESLVALIEATKNKVLPSASSILSDDYANFSEYEKSLISRIETSPTFYADFMGAKPILQYYDDKTVVYGTPSAKSTMAVGIYDMNNLQKLNKRGIIFFDKNYIKTDSYVIATLVHDPTGTNIGENLGYYVKGATDFQIIASSTLPENETYVKTNFDMSAELGLSFDELSKTLTASVFKRGNGTGTNIKLRTVKFVLP